MFALNCLGATMSNITSSSVRVDYLTVTTEDDITGMQWRRYLEARASEKFAAHVSEWRNKWYSGFQTDGYRWGYSDKQGYLLQVSGSEAEKVWRKVVPEARNISRIDLAVTLELAIPKVELARQTHSDVTNAGNNATFITSPTGDTCYVGSRKSEKFGRLYDKGGQLGTHERGRLWRYELELKGDVAKKAANHLIGGSVGDIADAVWDFFWSRGAKPYFERGKTDGLDISLEAHKTSAEGKLEWLSKQVAPTVRYLRGKGLETEVLEALGLADWYVKRA
jgi:hypothetical protein